ncbi:hypothetical protein EGW08_000742 [Elysia chlorotica]|uniref:Fucosyltransferase n=1 Tax=Elysia chlorotica TaxID=188477 RepID=A0A433UCE0_ELYCH|nr:hypothetical protein EGW08_000742 [Elysia chlorotica]
MSLTVHQKTLSSSPSSSALPAAAVAPASLAAERSCCGRWCRVRGALTALVLCALTALFIQQTEFVSRWRPALPLGTGSRAQARTDSPHLLHHVHREEVLATSEPENKVEEDTEYAQPRPVKSNTLFKKRFKSKPQKESTIESHRETNNRENTKITQPEPINSSKSILSSPLIVTEKDWPLWKHLNPISIKTALGLSSSKDTSLTRPITIAYIRNCKTQDPHCIEDKPMNFAKRCPYPGLVKTGDWDKADIVVINTWRIRSERYVPTIHRPPGQIWVMFSVEAPSRKNDHSQLDYEGLKGQFNLTMTYRLDSDIPYPYGRLQMRDVPDTRDLDKVYSRKRFQVAWLVSHCTTSSKREDYVQRLQAAGLEVHIYGSCGNYSCHDGGTNADPSSFAPDSICLPHISKNYFFYLSFENSLCKDYMTEKIFKIYDSVDLIPIVMGGADYNRYLPARTFVNTADFVSPADLARYVQRLAGDKRRYLGMLREKNKWQRLDRPPWYCSLGEKLATGLTPRVQPDVRSWYVRGQCSRPHKHFR